MVAAVSASSGLYKPETSARAFYALGLGLVLVAVVIAVNACAAGVRQHAIRRFG